MPKSHHSAHLFLGEASLFVFHSQLATCFCLHSFAERSSISFGELKTKKLSINIKIFKSGSKRNLKDIPRSHGRLALVQDLHFKTHALGNSKIGLQNV